MTDTRHPCPDCGRPTNRRRCPTCARLQAPRPEEQQSHGKIGRHKIRARHTERVNRTRLRKGLGK